MPSRPQVCGGTEIEMVVKITVGPKIVVGPKIERLVLQKLPAHLKNDIRDVGSIADLVLVLLVHLVHFR